MLAYAFSIYIFTIPFKTFSIHFTHLFRVNIIILAFSMFMNWNILFFKLFKQGFILFNGLFSVNLFNINIENFILFISILIMTSYLIDYKQNLNTGFVYNIYNKQNIFHIIIMITIFAQIYVIASYDFFSLFISIEMQTFSILILIYIFYFPDFYNTQNKRYIFKYTFTNTRYFFMGTFASILILFGISIIYYFIGVSSFKKVFIFFNSIQHLEDWDKQIVEPCFIAIFSIFIGLFFKIGAAPFHIGTPNIYNNFPNIILIWIFHIPKISILYVIAYIFYFFPDFYLIKQIFIFFGFYGIFIGAIMGNFQNKIKKLITYSSINHIGFLIMAIAINNRDSIQTFIFYFFQYFIVNYIVFFLFIFADCHFDNKYTTFKDKNIIFFKELFWKIHFNHFFKAAFSIAFFSMIGIPPLIGFFAKMNIIFSSIFTDWFIFTFAIIFFTISSAFFYLNFIKFIFFDTLYYNHTDFNINYFTHFQNLFSHTYFIKYFNTYNFPFFIIANITVYICFGFFSFFGSPFGLYFYTHPNYFCLLLELYYNTLDLTSRP